MRESKKSPLKPRPRARRPFGISRRHFLGGILGMGSAMALGLALKHRREEGLSLHEADFYKRHDPAG